MTKLSHLMRSLSIALSAIMFLLTAIHADAADSDAQSRLKIDNHSFRCITEMTPVRQFYVDNLLGNLEGTVAAANAGTGDYPEGSVVQLVPTEVMIKHEKGFNTKTRDWEFFLITVGSDGSKIERRGFADVANRFDMNCFACHAQAKAEFDLICEQGHGCDPIPLTRAMFAALQRTDPRCRNTQPPSAEDTQALKDLDETLRALSASQKARKQ
jgi:hypothetical protein